MTVIGLRKAAAFSLAVGGVLSVGAAPSSPVDVEPQHVITCKWNEGAGTPWGSTATTVMGFVQVECSDSLDKAHTEAKIQIFRDAAWRDQGPITTSYSTAKTIHVNATASKRIGTWYYRARGEHYGQHGNVWTLPGYYSPQRSLTRNG